MHRPRYSSRPLPPYSYVPGLTPHPVSDPRGHMHGHRPAKSAALDPGDWQRSEEFLYGVDLFNHGYYWEAHEAWEGLWHAAGRAGGIALWLKSLIKLAAATVKLREGNAAAPRRHADRALELVRESGLGASASFCGVASTSIERIAAAIVSDANDLTIRPNAERLLSEWLKLA